MNVTIIGARNVGRGIGHQPMAGGLDVTTGSASGRTTAPSTASWSGCRSD
jgi:predicted dinucleotide-binding enzyme